MYQDPTLNDQSAWFTLDKIQLLQDEIGTVRELLELEPDSACKLSFSKEAQVYVLTDIFYK